MCTITVVACGTSNLGQASPEEAHVKHRRLIGINAPVCLLLKAAVERDMYVQQYSGVYPQHFRGMMALFVCRVRSPPAICFCHLCVVLGLYPVHTEWGFHGTFQLACIPKGVVMERTKGWLTTVLIIISQTLSSGWKHGCVFFSFFA